MKSARNESTALLFHEIAAPLSVMHSTVQMMERELDRLDETQDLKQAFRKELIELKGEINRLVSLLEGFRSRPTRLNLLPTDLRSFVTEWTKVIAAEAKNRSVHLDCHFPTSLPRMNLDREKMKQVLLNLCKNALEAMPGGGRLSIGARSDDNSIIVEISDTGVGIPQGVNIFAPFATTKPHGTGLGLTVVRQIVRSHGGKVTYSSRPGGGSSFSLAFALAKKKQPSARRHQPAAPAAGASSRRNGAKHRF